MKEKAERERTAKEKAERDCGVQTAIETRSVTAGLRQPFLLGMTVGGLQNHLFDD